MSDPTPEPTPTPTPAPPAQDTPDWKAEARKWEERSKANKTALDEALARATTLESQVGELSSKVQEFETKAERAKTVAEVAEAAGVPASALRGNTREELEEHAKELAALIKPSGPIIPGQEKTPNKVADDPLREFTRNLFASAND